MACARRSCLSAGGCGASSAATASGSEDSPMRWLAKKLADHAIAAVTAIPIIATSSHNAVRRIMSLASYPAPD